LAQGLGLWEAPKAR